jgi:hypothetical protein
MIGHRMWTPLVFKKNYESIIYFYDMYSHRIYFKYIITISPFSQIF